MPVLLRGRKPCKDMDGALDTTDCSFESGVSFSEVEASCSDSETPGDISSTTWVFDKEQNGVDENIPQQDKRDIIPVCGTNIEFIRDVLLA